MHTVLADLTDADLVFHVRQLLASGAKLEVDTLLDLNLIHERKLYRPAGSGNFHTYCVNVLRMSDDTASRRSKVGKLLRLYPALVRDLIESQTASVTALAKLEPVITEKNAERLLSEVRGKTVRDVELMVVREAPKPAVQSGFRTVFAPSLSLNAELAVQSVATNAVCHAQATVMPSQVDIRIDAASAPAENTAPPRSKKRPIEPRAVDHYAFSANMNELTKTHLREAMDVGNYANYDALFAAAVEALRAQVLKKKYAQVTKPRQKSAAQPALTRARASTKARAAKDDAPAAAREMSALVAADSSAAFESEITERRAVSASTRRAVFIRDGGRCTFVGSEGRCTETRYLELHHRKAVANGGPSTVANVTLHCRSHNVFQAELDFGAAHMAQFEKTTESRS